MAEVAAMQEAAAGLTWYIMDHNLKLQFMGAMRVNDIEMGNAAGNRNGRLPVHP